MVERIGTSPVLTERLWPGAWYWVLGLGGAASLGIAYGAALTGAVGWLVGVAALIGVVAVGVRIAARIVVAEEGLRAGRALLPWQFVGRALALDAEQARRARGPDGDPTAFMLLRPGVGPGAVVVEVTDPQDPHRTWLLASRNPQRLARAIDGARGRLAP